MRKYFIEPERQKQCLHIKKYVKTEDAVKEDDRHQAMEKPTKAKTVTWMLRGDKSNVDDEDQIGESSAEGNTYAKQVAYLGPRSK
jgi:hypothetical protein